MRVLFINPEESISPSESRIIDYLDSSDNEIYFENRKESYDLIYSFSPFWSGYNSLFYSPFTEVLYSPHCIGFHRMQGRLQNLLKRFLLKTFSFSDRLYLRCISRWEYERYHELGISEDKLFYCPLGIDHDSFSDIMPSKDSRQIFSLANARRFKDVETQIRAVKRLAEEDCEVHLNVIGGWADNEYRAEIENLIQNLDIEGHVTVHGFVEREKMFEIMSKCEVFVHTSKFETQGLAIYEAAAAGFLICISDAPVHNQNFARFKHPQGDHEALAGDIKSVFEMDEEKKQQISDEMRDLAEDFSYEKERERLNEFFDDLGNYE